MRRDCIIAARLSSSAAETVFNILINILPHIESNLKVQPGEKEKLGSIYTRHQSSQEQQSAARIAAYKNRTNENSSKFSTLLHYIHHLTSFYGVKCAALLRNCLLRDLFQCLTRKVFHFTCSPNLSYLRGERMSIGNMFKVQRRMSPMTEKSYLVSLMQNEGDLKKF